MPLVWANIEKQDYPNIEVVISNDEKLSIGAQVNKAISESHGEYIARIDDDAWYSSQRISKQVEAIGDKPLCGTSSYYVYDLRTSKAYIVGGFCYIGYEGMFFTREAWKRNPHANVSMGEASFFQIAHTDNTADMKDTSLLVAFRHNQNVTNDIPPKSTPCNNLLVENLVGAELTRWKESIGIRT